MLSPAPDWLNPLLGLTALLVVLVLLSLALAHRALYLRRQLDAVSDRVDAACRQDLECLRGRLEQCAHQRALLGRHRDRLLGVVSHDLRGHVASLSFLAAAPNAPQVILNLYRQAANLVGLLESQRVFTSGMLSGDARHVMLRQVVEDCLDSFREQARQKGVGLVNSIPNVSASVSNPDFLVVLIKVMIDNGVKFCDQGDQVEIRQRRDGLPGFEVADTGPGVDPAVAPDLFRLDRGSRSFGSRGETGAGGALALCRALMKTIGGDVDWLPAWPVNAAGEPPVSERHGAVFRVRLPLAS